jgi:membrane complex biogenesis BtpA family protein
VGVIHLAPLAGAPNFEGDPGKIEAAALADAEALAEGGVDALLLENYGDRPFYPGSVPAVTVAQMTALALAVRGRSGLPLGINVLRNDAASALAVAHAAGGSFIRVNVLAGARVTDQGVISGRAHELLRMRRTLGAEGIRILADVDVKHSAPLAPYPLEEEVRDVLGRGGADAVIVTGPATGEPVREEDLHRVRDAAGRAPVWVGSGVTPETIRHLAGLADGFIVGTSLKEEGRVGNPVDKARVRALRERLAPHPAPGRN